VATPARQPGTWRYKVEELHLICRATSEADMVPSASIALAALTLMAFSAGGRPPIRPPARLAAKAVLVRSHPELPKSGENMEDQPPGRAGGVEFSCKKGMTLYAKAA
jgi:hypothetical protein